MRWSCLTFHLQHQCSCAWILKWVKDGNMLCKDLEGCRTVRWLFLLQNSQRSYNGWLLWWITQYAHKITLTLYMKKCVWGYSFVNVWERNSCQTHKICPSFGIWTMDIWARISGQTHKIAPILIYGERILGQEIHGRLTMLPQFWSMGKGVWEFGREDRWNPQSYLNFGVQITNV